MTRVVTLALLLTVIAAGTVLLGSMLPDMPSLTPVDGYDGRTDQPNDAPTCALVGCCDDGTGACCYCSEPIPEGSP